jgi:hypothetical protein
MESQSTNDVRPDQYPNVIRDLIKHEDDVTNHRLMWLLIVQGLLVNAYVVVRADARAAYGIATAGILVTLSAFVMLYKSYQARGYLHFLGAEAKLGRLSEKYLRLDGWPYTRIKNWRKGLWVCPWFKKPGDLMEPMLSLPLLIMGAWLYLMLDRRVTLSPPILVGVAIILGTFILFVFCALWVRSQETDEEERTDQLGRS